MSKTVSRKLGVWSAALVGFLVAIVLSVVGALIAAICINNEYLNITNINYIALFLHIISSFVGTLSCGMLAREKKVLACAGAIGGYLLVYLAIAVAAFDGVGDSIYAGTIDCAIGCSIGLLLCNRNKNRTRSARRRKVFR